MRNGGDFAESLVGHLVDHDEAWARGAESRFDSEVRSMSSNDLLMRNLACIDMLHRMWPNEEATWLPAEDAEGLAWGVPDLPGFSIVREIGRGGMGIVYEAEEVVLGRRVALKLLPVSTLSDAQQRLRFQTEARAGATLRHPNIVPVYSFVGQGSTPYFAMQLIEGASFSDVIARLRSAQSASVAVSVRSELETAPTGGRLTLHDDGCEASRSGGESAEASPGCVANSVLVSLVREYSQSKAEYFQTVARWGAQLAEALAFAHDQGVVHRDIKPSNILLDSDRNPWITDFGLARFVSEATMTRTGDVLGTLRFMAPEQALGERAAVDPGADIYGLGMTLYELLTLRPAFDAVDRRELLRQIASADASTPRSIDRTIPLDLDVIVRKAIEADPQARYGSARGLADDLTRFLGHRPIAARPPGPWVRTLKWARRRPAIAASLALCFLALAGFWASSWSHARSLAKALKQSEHHRKQAEASSKQALDREQQLRNQQHAWRIKLVGEAMKSRNGVQFRSMLNLALGHEPASQSRGFEYQYLQSLLHSEVRLLPGHTQRVNSVVYSPDGQRMATASDDGTVRIWRAGTDELVSILRGHTGCVNEVQFDPSGTWLATASCDRTAKRWDLTSGSELATYPHDSPVFCLAISPDGSTLATGTGDGMLGTTLPDLVTTWDVATGQRNWQLLGHASDIMSAAYSPDGATLATGSSDGTVREWNSETGELIQRLVLHNFGVPCVRYSPDGRNLAAACSGTVTLWQPPDPKPKKVLHCYHGVYSVAFSPDGEFLAAGTDDGLVAIWDSVSAEPRTIRLCDHGRIHALAFDHDGQSLAYGAWDGTAGIWNAVEEPGRVSRSCAAPSAIVFDPGVKNFYAVFEDGRVARHPVGRGEGTTLRQKLPERITNPDLNSRRMSIAVSSSGTKLVVPAGGGDWEMLELPTGKRLGSLVIDEGELLTVAFLDSDCRILGCAHVSAEKPECAVMVWDTATCRLAYQFSIQDSVPLAMAIHPRGNSVAVCLPGALEVYELPTGRQIARFEGTFEEGMSAPYQIAYSPDGQFLTSARRHNRMSLWDPRSGRERFLFVASNDDVNGATISPDGQTVVTGEQWGKVKLWNIASGLEMLELKADAAAIQGLQFSPDGQRLGCWGHSGSETKEVTVWSVE